ncbi:MAG: branched-chain amino acid ABC transporter permease [Terriglobales bacterium]
MSYRLLIALLAVLLLVPAGLSGYALQVAVQALVVAVFAMSFNLLFHQTGLLSFGHAAFFGTGAYAAAIAASRWDWPLAATLPLSLVVTAVVALVIGFFSVRLTKIYFTMLTLAFAQMLWAVVHKWYDFTGGDNGITGLQAGGILGTTRGVYYVSLAALVFVVMVVRTITFSPAGYTLRAVRDNPARAEAIGISAFQYALAAFVVSGVLSGLAGFLHVTWQHSAFPDQFYWTTSAEVIIATILGGSDFFLGPLIGAIVLVAAEAIVRSRTQYWPLALGLVLLVLVLFSPKGVIGLAARGARSKAGRAEKEDRRAPA